MTKLTPVDGNPFAQPAAKLTPVDGDPFHIPPPPPGFTIADDSAPPSPPPGFSVPPESSAVGAGIRHAGAGVLPAVGGTIGFGGGFAPGGLITAPAEAIPIVGQGINLLGAVGGGLAGAYGGGALIKNAQDKVLSLLPTGVVKALGQDDAQKPADETQHLYASFTGNLLPAVILMKPGPSSYAVEEGACKLTKFLAHFTGGAVVGAGLTSLSKGGAGCLSTYSH